MAEEKKKPDLKARLNRTVVGQAPPVAPAAPDVPGTASAPVSGGFEAAPPAGGSDIAVPEFIKQQIAEKAAAEARAAEEARLAAERLAQAAAELAAQERARAMAADPFASSAVAAGPQEIRLVIDEKAVSDEEVGRKNTGAVIGLVLTGVIALGAGFLVGGFMETRREGARTVEAIGAIRTSVDAAGAIITQLKDKVDHAATAAGIAAAGETEGQAAPTAAPATATIDEELLTWFGQQPPDPPLGPEVYAGRVGRLRPDLVQKLMKVQFDLTQAWNDMRRHQGATQPNLVVIRQSMQDLQRSRTEFQRLAVVFAPGVGDGPRVLGTLVSLGQALPTGALPIAPALAGAPTRTLYAGGDLAAPATVGTVAIPVSVSGGLGAVAVGGLTRPWAEYVNRVRNLRALADTLAQDHRQLSDALNRAGSGGAP